LKGEKRGGRITKAHQKQLLKDQLEKDRRPFSSNEQGGKGERKAYRGKRGKVRCSRSLNSHEIYLDWGGEVKGRGKKGRGGPVSIRMGRGEKKGKSEVGSPWLKGGILFFEQSKKALKGKSQKGLYSGPKRRRGGLSIRGGGAIKKERKFLNKNIRRNVAEDRIYSSSWG